VDVQAVRAAAARIEGRVWRTPTLRCPALDALCGAELWLKAENLQRIGAFKARGAMHAVGKLDAAVRARGVVTYSSGNHGQAVALAARDYRVPAFVAMPVDAPPVKLSAVRALGAEVVLAGTTSAERRDEALRLREGTGATIIEPFDQLEIIEGQGTATLELLDDVRAATGGGLDALVVPVGGGGLIAGACLACSGTPTRIWAVEPQGCDAMGQSLARGERVMVPPAPTLADGLKPVQVGELNFAIARERLAGALTVDDAEMGRALVQLLLLAKVLVEPSGAAALAAALRGLDGKPRRVGVILSGGNLEPSLLATLLSTHATTRAGQ
jgi:threonine dehydratase